MAGEYTFSDLLKQFRVRARMSQQQLAEKLGKHRNTIVAWEAGDRLPHNRPLVLELAEILRLSQQDTDTLLQASIWQPSHGYQETTPPVFEVPLPPTSVLAIPLVSSWNVPYRRNPFFTGRQDVLKHLRSMLTSEKAAALTQTQAISGLGGVGKSQTAVEYAYRYQGDYKTILWARADSREALVSDFVSIAHLLKLPEKDEQDQSRVVNACKHWLHEHADWLLILDNADDLALASDFIPAGSQGHTLLTTREQATGTIARRIELATMKPEEGALFLLRRAQILATDAPPDDASHADWIRAREITRLMDGLPLALDQAGAYIEETACGLAGYQERYKTQRAKLLRLRGKAATYDHPESVATTWSLSFERVQRANPAAADLLRLCAFLHPDAIPEEIITAGAPDLGPALQPFATELVELDSAISELRRYSLLRRVPEAQTLGIHRLVQAVLQDALSEAERRAWAERAVLAVNAAFPDTEYSTWSQCERLLPHALLVAEYIKTNPIISEEAGRLLNETARYLYERAQYPQALPLYQRALHIQEQYFGLEHSNVAYPLHNLANLYREQAKYAEAEPLFQRALHIREQRLGSEHSNVATSLNSLANLYRDQSRYTEAEPLFQRALRIWEQQLGIDHPQVASPLDNLAILYKEQGKYAEAEPLFQRALHIREQQLGIDHPKVGISLNNLGELYREQGKYTEAEPLYWRALHIWEQQLGPEHPDVAYPLHNLAELYREQGKYAEAEPLYQRALRIWEQQLGTEHPNVAYSFHGLANLYREQGRYAEAEPLYQRALRIRTQCLGSQHPETAEVMFDLARFRETQGNRDEARPLYEQALAVREHVLGSEHPKTKETRKRYITLLR